MPFAGTVMADELASVAAWQITEGPALLKEGLSLSGEEQMEFEGIRNETRKSEWLATRHLLFQLQPGERRTAVLKDSAGKPYWPGDPLHFSVSHTKNWAIGMISSVPCGIDIEKPQHRVSRVISRVCSDTELAMINEERNRMLSATLFWCAKESVYKAYGKEGIDLRSAITVEHITKRDAFYLGRALLKVESNLIEFILKGMEWQDFIIMTAVIK